MSGKPYWYPDREPDKASWDFTAKEVELELGRTCLV
jgi:hypothetical protein